MGNEHKRQLKMEKIISTLAASKYSVIEWYLNSNNTVIAFLVRNILNYIDFICYIPDNVLLTVENGLYCTKISSPDFDLAKKMWDEISLDHIAIKVSNGIIFKKDKIWEEFVLSPDKKSATDLEEVVSTSIGLDETNIKVVTENPSVEIVGDKLNPFDIILDGGDYKPKTISSRIEESQPNILINYKGFTYGQAVPFVNFKIFTNDLALFHIKLAKMNKEILNYQSVKVKTCANDALTVLNTFKESLEKSIKEWDDQWSNSSELLGRIQTILEKSTTKKGDEFQTKANTALKETIEQLLQKRDSLIGILMNCKEIFHQI